MYCILIKEGALLGGISLGVSLWVTDSILLARAAGIFVVVYASVSAIIGSLLDSFLGATLQYSGYDRKLKCVVETAGPNVEHICGHSFLDNHQINLLTSVIMLLGGLVV
jgi:uncharacterized membrane protein